MKKFLLTVLLSVFMAEASYGSVEVVATIFPIYDWVKEISKGSDVNINLLLDSGVDLHSFQPAVDDMVKIAKCDVFVYVGGESDEWVEDSLKNVVNKNQVSINLLKILGDKVKSEEIVEGMEHEHEHHEHEHESESESDEHIWLSLRNAEIICKYIAEKLSELDENNKEIYSQNCSEYVKKLSELDSEYDEVIDKSMRKILLFADRFPFRYMADDYGLKYYAAFSGCSAETEASFETVMFLSNKVDELKLPYVLTIDGTKHKIAETVISNTKSKNQKILVLDSMQSTTLNNNTSYLEIMQKNLETLKTVLN
ncbi:MAG: zinc ABC transporter substrate-binding protein [Synergistaceae bacterium]|nr:zinc ABC transporter substrate-binding protein [Synergistaceae bacterium]MBR0075542.1 zinc ABC transporter substrate-binding protein [Synergistaceae bacterium]